LLGRRVPNTGRNRMTTALNCGLVIISEALRAHWIWGIRGVIFLGKE
jgi:hypothetical protein